MPPWLSVRGVVFYREYHKVELYKQRIAAWGKAKGPLKK